MPSIVDLTHLQPDPPLRYRGSRKHRIRKGRVVRRDLRDVDTIVIHQTACTFGQGRLPTRHHRALGVACHSLAFNDGTIVRANPLESYVYHGNGFNARSCGLEIEGSFPGLMDDPETPRREDLMTHWGDDDRMTPVTDLVVETASLALADMVKRLPAVRYIVAHRQSSKNRRSDPGAELWQRVVLDYAVPELGLETRPGATRGHGRPIPKVWDPDGVGPY